MVYLTTKIGICSAESSDYLKTFAKKEVHNPIALIPAIMKLLDNELTHEMVKDFDPQQLD
jgi:hypothetical protein